MIQSMTGFGTGTSESGDERISVEVRAVNHKFCDVKARLPRELMSLEPVLIKQIRGKLVRGGIEAVVFRQRLAGSVGRPRADLELAQEYARLFQALAQKIHLPETTSLDAVLQAEGVLQLETRPANLQDSQVALERATELALGVVVGMRQQEGQALDRDLRERVGTLRQVLGEIAELAPKALEGSRSRLERRVADLTKGGAEIEPERLAQEIVLLAERSDIAEEITRLESHLEQFSRLLESEELVGRRLDFLVQEIHREANTIGSKAQGTELSAKVVDLKVEAERIREQVQNVA
jgi:uncharacterized protein (TIGR00255 family)